MVSQENNVDCLASKLELKISNPVAEAFYCLINFNRVLLLLFVQFGRPLAVLGKVGSGPTP